MKLKKIASLALAGIMAISMLTACGNNGDSDKKPGEGTPEVTPVTGVAASINAELDENKDVISFDDNETLANLVKTYFDTNPIKADFWNQAANNVSDMSTQASAINSVFGADKTGRSDVTTMLADKTQTNKQSGLVVYGFNAKWFNQDAILKYVGQLVDSLDLPEDGNTTNDGKVYDYSGSVAAVKVESAGGSESVWVVAVEITKDYVNG